MRQKPANLPQNGVTKRPLMNQSTASLIGFIPSPKKKKNGNKGL